jgi:hypothetical protein
VLHDQTRSPYPNRCQFAPTQDRAQVRAEIGLAAVDIHAGVPHWHDRFGAFARTASGQLCVAEFYGARNRTLGRADPAYLQPIIAAARRWKFPQQYIEEIGGWARLEPLPRGTRRGAR